MTKSVDVDLSDVKLLGAKLTELRAKSVPFAIRNALNTIAFKARNEWVGQMQKSLTLRNDFTTKSLRIEKATGYDVATMQSKVGSLAPYMGDRELGETERSTGKHGVPIPTSAAAGMAKSAKRTKAVQRKNWKTAIALVARVSYGNRQYRNSVAIAEAAKTGGVAFLNLGRRKGLFRITGKPGGRLKIRMLYDMSQKTVTTKPIPTLQPTLEAMTYMGPRILELELQKEIASVLARLASKGG